MADHADKSAGTTGNRSLDQSAIDEAIAAMQTGDPDMEQAAGQGTSDQASQGDAGDTNASAEVLQTPVLSNGGETFGQVQSDGQEDLDAAIAAIQADVVEEAAAFQSEDDADSGNADAATPARSPEQAETVEEAAADAAAAEAVSQEDIDAATATSKADTVEAEEVAATDESGAQRLAGHVTDPTTDTTAPASVDERKPDPVDDRITEKPTADTTAGDEASPGVDAIDAERSWLADGDHLADTETAEDPNLPPDQGAGAPAMELAGSDAVATVESENTFSDLDESDLEAPRPDPADAEAAQLAAMTANFDDENEHGAPDKEDRVPSASLFADRSADAGPAPPENAGGKHDPETAAGDANMAKRAALKSSAGHSKKGKRQKKSRGILLTAVIIVFGLAALYGRDFYSDYRERVQRPAPPPPVAEPAAHWPVSVVPAVASKPQDPYREKLQEVGRLRADLLAKKTEIDQLKQFYRDGISELEEELQQEVARLQINTFTEALANHKIELDLRSIQRRRAYIDELEKPSSWLHQGSEELLFLSRRAQIDLQMSTIASGIEMTRHTRHLNASLQKYQLSPERLAIEPADSRLRPLEEIWNAIGEQNKSIARHAVAHGDQAIIDDICEGDTGRIAELKTLTIRASKCLSRIESSELFLNQLSSISPVAAKYLSQWNGQWLCLNGFRQLSPDVARHLFRWNGDWMSLNGLKTFPPEIGEMLIAWQGRQLELMGLMHDPEKMELVGYQQLADWEKSGGRLFVPEPIRSEIEKLNDRRGPHSGPH